MTSPLKHTKSSALLGLVVTLLLILGRPALAAGTEPSAELSPGRIPAGGTAVLRISTDAERPPEPVAPPELRLTRSGQSTRLSSINGVLSKNTSEIYRVTAARPGTYTIRVGAQSLDLKVDPAAAGSTPASGASPVLGRADAAVPGSLAFLRVHLPRGKLYVGQSVPVTVKAYFRPGMEVRLSGLPDFGLPAFTLSQLTEEPRQSVETVSGVPYRVATWTGLVSAAMPGRYPTRATLPVVVRYRESAPAQDLDPLADLDGEDGDDGDMMPSSALLRSLMRRSLAGGGMDDLFGRVRERELTLRAEEHPVEVLPLPTQGRPRDFSGAVGDFDLRATLEPQAGTAFEPLSLKLAISGRGSFERVSTPGLPASDSWKSYPPSARFTPSGAAPTTAGVKVFEQAVVPQRSGRLELPALSFSFFSPEKERYVTRSTDPIAVQIAAAPAGSAAGAAGLSAAARGDTLRPDHPEGARPVTMLLPPYRTSRFWLLWAVPWLALALGLLLLRARGRGPSARSREQDRSRTLARHRTAMRQAAAAHDPLRFYTAAEQLVQARLGARWGLGPDEVTAAAVDSRMGPAGAPLASALRTAEQIRYAGHLPQRVALGEYGKSLEQKLDQLEDQP